MRTFGAALARHTNKNAASGSEANFARSDEEPTKDEIIIFQAEQARKTSLLSQRSASPPLVSQFCCFFVIVISQRELSPSRSLGASVLFASSCLTLTIRHSERWLRVQELRHGHFHKDSFLSKIEKSINQFTITSRRAVGSCVFRHPTAADARNYLEIAFRLLELFQTYIVPSTYNRLTR